MATLFGRYYRDFSPKHISIWLPQTAVTAAYVLMDDLENPRVRELYHDVCQVITSASRRFFCMRGHARMLLITAEEKGHSIPDDAKRILKKVAVDGWKPDDHKLFVGSIFPNYVLAKRDDPRVAGMGDLLERWKNLSFQETTGSDADRSAPPRTSSMPHNHRNLSDMDVDRPTSLAERRSRG